VDMFDPVYLLVIVGAVALLIVWRIMAASQRIVQRERQSAASLKTDVSDKKGAPPAPSYKAKTLRIGSGACQQALNIRDKAFLAAEAPKLPLPGCNRTCFCEYSDKDDRRSGSDRRYPSADIMDIPGAQQREEQRLKKDRRKNQEGKKGIYNS
jgi:hypothetical protein